jgi:hypothetical protein
VRDLHARAGAATDLDRLVQAIALVAHVGRNRPFRHCAHRPDLAEYLNGTLAALAKTLATEAHVLLRDAGLPSTSPVRRRGP